MPLTSLLPDGLLPRDAPARPRDYKAEWPIFPHTILPQYAQLTSKKVSVAPVGHPATGLMPWTRESYDPAPQRQFLLEA